jgi:hypothetical protein
LPIIGKLLGHAHANTTARYAHLDADPLRRASDRIGNHIAAVGIVGVQIRCGHGNPSPDSWQSVMVS